MKEWNLFHTSVIRGLYSRLIYVLRGDLVTMETGSFLGDGHKFAQLAPEPLGENLSLFNAISCVLVWVFMHGASEKWKENIKNISETKPEQEDFPTLK